MSHSVVRLLKHDSMKLMRWAVLILPLFFCGCFDTQSTAKTSGKSRESGIALLSRFFDSDQASSQSKTTGEQPGTTTSDYVAGITAIPELEEDVADHRIAMPSFMGAEIEGFSAAGSPRRSSDTASGNSRREQVSSLRNAVSLVFNTPFNLMFSKVFKQTKSEESAQPIEAAQSIKEELPNPFTEAIQKKAETTATDTGTSSNETGSDTTKVAENKTDSTEKSKEQDSGSSKEGAKSGNNNPVATTGNSGAFTGNYLIVGDFDGTGVLKAIAALRSTDTHFVSADGEREFNLYINAEAVAQSRSFYIDDMDNDGNADILVTSPETLFGGVFLGDGSGGYRLGAKFLTGYEPSLASAGPFRNGMRQIVSVGSNSGTMRSFLYADKYRVLQEGKLRFAPQYLMHLVTDTALELVLARQLTGAEQILGWQESGHLLSTSHQLGDDATVLSLDRGAYTLTGHQVGQYASIVLSSQGMSFNVANMKILPRTYLVIGDLKRKGTLDVAVAGLEAFSPAE
jgi:hypothetical protein